MSSISSTAKGKYTPEPEDHRYPALVKMIQKGFIEKAAAGPLFATDIQDPFQVFLSHLEPEERQHYNCNSCRRFINRFGGLVSIDSQGKTNSFLTEMGVSNFFLPSIRNMIKYIESAKVTGVFLTTKLTLGEPTTGEWNHMAVKLKTPIFTERAQDAGQVMAEKLEDYKMTINGLIEFPLPVVTKALVIMEADALYRSEKVLGPAKWLRNLHEARAETRNARLKENLTWLAVATAPVGFAHIRSSMIGTLLEDITNNLPMEDIRRKFADKMHPLKYQRPTAVPAVGNVKQAEKLVDKLGIEPAFHRRFARLEDLQTFWTPAPAVKSKDSGGLFKSVKTKNTAEPGLGNKVMLPEQTLTMEKFRQKVLPKALGLEMFVPTHGHFTALVTAEDPDAPPIIQWDTEEQRNPVSWYFYNGGSKALNFNLMSGNYIKVNALCENPAHWFGRKSSNIPPSVVLILDGAKDLMDAGSALFPEILKSELHAVRATIESYSRSAKISGREEASAAGWVFTSGENVGMAGGSIKVRVTTKDSTQVILLDRWD